MKPVTILNSKHFKLTISRLCYQLIENHNNFENSVLIGLQPRGVYLANRIKKVLESTLSGAEVQCGALDITFYRDDFRRTDKSMLPSVTDIDFIIENKKVVLIDDVLFTGRTVRSGLDAMLAFGRPEQVEFLTLIDRRFSRQLPIQPDYVGKSVDTLSSERVSVEWSEMEGKDKVMLYTTQ